MPRPHRLAAWLLIIAGCAPGSLLAGAEPGPPLPLPVQSIAATGIIQALMALRRGDIAPLEALPGSAFTAPIAFPDERDADLQRPWTAALPAALAGLDAPARGRALAALDRLYRGSLPETADAADGARAAADFVPAPAAVAELTTAADRAFDRGAFEDFLGIARLLDAAGRPPAMAERRQRVALLLSGRGPEVDAGLALPPPGAPQPSAAQPLPDQPRLAVSWVATPGWLLACDPWGRISWQYRVDRAATVVPGAGAALVQDSNGLRALGDDGAITVLGPLPSGARVLAVAGGAAWFATGARAWRLELGADRVQALELGGEPLSPPLVRGRESLWLTARELLLFDGDRLLARLRHGLPAGSGWRLGADRSHPLVVGADGRSWRLEALNEQLAHAAPADKARLLVQAARCDEAIAALAGSAEAASPDGRRILLRAHLGLGAAHAARESAAMLALAQDAQEEVVVRQAAYLGALQATPHDPGLADLERQAVAALARAHPELLFSPCTLASETGTDFSEPPAEWPVALSGAGYALALDDAAAFSRPGTGTLLGADARPSPFPADQLHEQRQPDGTTRYRRRQLRLVSRVERKEVRCFDQRGTLLWWHRWAGLPLLEAPSTSLLCRGGAVLVCEGQRRLRAIDLLGGVQLAQLDLDGRLASLGDAAVLDGGRLALLGPVGVNTRLLLTGPGGGEIELPVPARWLLGAGRRALVALHDGRVLAYPGGEAVALPPAVAEARSAPAATAAGVIVGDRLYPWLAP